MASHRGDVAKFIQLGLEELTDVNPKQLGGFFGGSAQENSRGQA